MMFGCKISGTITKDGVGVEDVTVSISGPYNTTKTNSDGYYEFNYLRPGTYTITPAIGCGNSDPASQKIQKSLFKDVTDVNFIFEENVYSGDFSITNASDLDALSGYTSISGNLTIDGTSLTNLDGLECLLAIGGYLHVGDNTQLNDLHGLQNLSTVNQRVTFDNNDGLTNLDGLESLTEIGEALVIKDNSSLVNIDGLSQVTNIGLDLYIYNNDALLDVNGLSSLETIMHCLLIYGNDKLKNLNGLGALTKVGEYGGYLMIYYNVSLTDLGLNSLIYVNGDFLIQNNSNLCTSKASALKIQVNNAEGITGTITISGNKSC